MSTYEQLHDFRRRLATTRQQDWAARVNELDALLEGRGRQHPYELTNEDRHVLMAHDWFAKGCGGPSASVRGSYVYHLTSIAKLKLYTNWHLPDPSADDEQIHRMLLERGRVASGTRGGPSPRPAGWLLLSDCAAGQLTGFRRMTWWTSEDVSKNPLDVGRRLGLPDDWIPVNAVIARISLPTAIPMRFVVPNVLDAYLSCVFHPTPSGPSTSAGITIDLSVPQCRDGLDEYLVDAIPVDLIQCLPISLNSTMRSMRPPVYLGPELFARLASYYTNLL